MFRRRGAANESYHFHAALQRVRHLHERQKAIPTRAQVSAPCSAPRSVVPKLLQNCNGLWRPPGAPPESPRALWHRITSRVNKRAREGVTPAHAENDSNAPPRRTTRLTSTPCQAPRRG
eukprot:4450375-Pyramimonas_sp.AAC.1